jgi:HD superfamily phosphohydrolase
MHLSEPPVDDFATMRDHDLMARLAGAGPVAQRLIERVLCRELYKTAYRVESRGRDDQAAKVADLMAKVTARQLEEQLIAEAGLARGDVIVDLPVSVFELSEPRLKQFRLKVLRRSGERVRLLDLSTLAQALTRKESAQTVFAAYCDRRHRDAIAAACRARLE